MAKRLTIGLTGPTGAGKSSLRRVFERYCCEVIDCDLIAREITMPGSPVLAELAQTFGSDILAPDGSLIRSILAQRAFSTSEGKSAIDKITHPRVLEIAAGRAQDIHLRGRHAVIDAPLLFESGGYALCDVTVAVVASDEIRLERIMQRDGITREAARLRMSAQQPAEFYTSRADYIITNDGTLEQLSCRASAVLRDLLGSSIS